MYNSKKIIGFNSSNYTCFNCDKEGHIKVECPNFVSQEKAPEMKYEKRGKAKSTHCMARQ